MQVLTSLSGLPFSAASAGFAPTNSADVSAIASAYQVVSSTATQLHAGTAYLTSVNGAPISAARAGQAANASLATSAYYDGTGRLISALPDSAAVSAIASSYAESAASGKQDTIEFGYDANNLISSIDGSGLAGGGGGGLITSIESAIDPWYRTAISGLNGSSLYPKWAETAKSAEYASQAVSANYAASAPTAWASSFITGVASQSGTIRVLSGTAIEATNSALLPSTLIPGFESASAITPATSIGPDVFLTGTIPSENPYTNLVLRMGWGELTVSITGNNGETASVSKGNSDEFVTAQLPNATSYSLTTDVWVSVVAITASAETQEEGGGVGELAWASALPTYEYDGDGKISAIDGSALAGGGGGGVDSATVSAIASAYVESGVSSKLDSSASSDFYTTANESGFVDSAYVDSAVSGKMDASAIDYTRTGGGTQIYASGTGSSTNQFSAKNDSAGAAIIAGENARLRLWDTAATANLYASSIGGWNAASNLVSSQSANWGGSALQLSAGPGVTLTKSGNVLVASTDETLLYDCSNNYVYGTNSVTLSESYKNFEIIKILNSKGNVQFYYPANNHEDELFTLSNMSNGYLWLIPWTFISETVYSGSNGKLWTVGTTTVVDVPSNAGSNRWIQPIKIFGINRTAGV